MECILPLTRASVKSLAEPVTLIPLLTVTVPVVALPIPLRAVAAIVAVLVVAWNAASVTVTKAVPAVIESVTKAFVTCACEPTIFAASLTVKVPVVFALIALRPAAVIVAVLVVAWNAASLIEIFTSASSDATVFKLAEVVTPETKLPEESVSPPLNIPVILLTPAIAAPWLALTALVTTASVAV